jgi:DNA repair protein RecO (recombination protein O)
MPPNTAGNRESRQRALSRQGRAPRVGALNLERSTGIVLRTRLLTETSLIVNWLTPEFGRIATVAKGARRAKSPFRGKLDLFYRAEFSFARSRHSDLHTLREVRLLETHPALRHELSRLQQASYAAALIEQTTETETPIGEIFALLDSFLRHVSDAPSQPVNLFAFEMKLLHMLGQSPDLKAGKLHPGTRQILEKFNELDWPILTRLKPSASQIREVQQFLHDFILFHLGRIPDGRATALTAESRRE